MAAPVLPGEILLMVAQCDTETFRAMLTLSPVVVAVRSPHALATIQDGFTVCKIDKSWDTKYKLCGRLHRNNDLPAIISVSSVRYYRHGKLYRDGNQPAVVYQDNGLGFYPDYYDYARKTEE